MERVLLIDSNSIMNRAFYALPPLTNSEGLHTNAIYGFANMIFKIEDEIQPDYIIATFDRKAPTFRHEEYTDYKAGRKRMPDELAEQFPVVKDMLALLGIPVFELDGFEADDLLGTISKLGEESDKEVYILTGDRDALQLASDSTKIIITKKGVSEKEIYDHKKMIEDFGVTPTQFIDVKGLMGDKSDNIPGVPGIGEKTAYKLIQTYGTLENVLDNIEEISGKKIKENLENHREDAVFSKRLATIMRNVPVDFTWEDKKHKEHINNAEVRNLFLKLGMKSLLGRFEVSEEKEEVEKIPVKIIDSLKDFKELVSSIKKEVYIVSQLINEELYSKINIDKLFISTELGDYEVKALDIEKENREEYIKLLKKIFENDNIIKYSYGIKNTLTVLRKFNIEPKAIEFDVELAAYIIDSSKGKYPLEVLIGEYLGKELKGSQEEMKADGVHYLKDLSNIFIERLKADDMEELYYKVELPLADVLSAMECEGFKVNKNMLEELSVTFKKEIEETGAKIYELAGEEFNINSPKQLGKILFEKLDLPPVKKTKTGYSTNAEVLEKLVDKHPIIKEITYFRQISKIYSTYIEGLKNVIDSDGHIHSSFNQTVTTTGRLSSTEPNLQNIPIKYEMGRAIRKVFIPNNEDDLILSADYSQIELRVLAHMSGDENMINAFKEDIDIHTKTASEVFKVPLEEVTSLMRGRAKAVNFGIVYGISDFSLAQDLGITKKEAGEYMNIYFDRYPKIKGYLNGVIEKANEDGYVHTILNRRRFIPEIKASNKILKALGERLAMNAPIQGSAADIIKIAMIKVYDKLREKNLKSTLILQVHDELILNVKPNELEEVKKLVKTEMENVLELSVPLEVDLNVGHNWYDAK
ncbi:DNA polymerase I [Clostridium sp. 'White wine YQ']|uniref:DNA polymerase I n=1 Tax=Clostridium sp. 'White wine YQ' TaxID=3027474 RepID=UPI0023650908|nr:DNA polymerase I [Clostridium sp. 'White wine YQ']MDD7794173.1 DNA polymerase I [Clostridium sp. 'White wine YQ']